MTSLSYETAKKLEDAGFPQDHPVHVRYLTNDTLPDISFPTLSELIEACGEDFSQLNHIVAGKMDKWFAFAGRAHGVGDTADEAMANLYLALHPGV
jgi:hypothetical protein